MGSPPLGGITSAVKICCPDSIARWSAVAKALVVNPVNYAGSAVQISTKLCAKGVLRPMATDDPTDPLTIALSAREIEIIELVADGLTNQEIADKLTISKRTVDNHVSNVFTKTGSKNRVALLNWAMDNGRICRDGFNCCALPESDSPES